MQRPILSVIVPAYNEENSVRPFLSRLIPIIEKLGRYEIIFCVDPSDDKTEQTIQEEAGKNPHIGMLVFSRRFGQPASTLAGIFHSTGDTCLVIDVDLQDPPEIIPAMLSKLREGYEVVYAKRKRRKGETWFKLFISHIGYRLINALSDVRIPTDTGDFRVMTRRVVEELKKLHESHGFLRGLVAFVGFRQASIEYDRHERAHGKGKYNRLVGSLKIGLNGLICYSNAPLAFSCLAGSIMMLAGFISLIGLSSVSNSSGLSNVNWAAIVISAVVFIGGVQLVAVGILGAYIGRIYDEVKRRPLYIVDRAVNVQTSA